MQKYSIECLAHVVDQRTNLTPNTHQQRTRGYVWLVSRTERQENGTIWNRNLPNDSF